MNLYKHPQGHVFYRKMKHGRPKISHGEGIYLVDESGKIYIDGSGGPLVINIGHGRSEIAAVMQEQALRVGYVHAIMFTSDAVEQYSEALAKVVPFAYPRFFYLSSGSEVAEAAIKLARQIQMARGEMERSVIISRQQSYHGMSLGALSVSGRDGLKKPYQKMMVERPLLAAAYTYRSEATGMEMAAELEATILQIGAENVAAFIAEPISGASLGAASPPDDYWAEIRRICDQHGVLWICDEVLVGFGRTGKWWGHQHWGAKPDIMIASKGIAGGYMPLGVVVAEGEDVDLIQKEFGDFNHGGTFSHHPIATAVAHKTLQILQEEHLIEHAAKMGDYLEKRLREAFGEHPNVGDIRGKGLFWGIEFVADRASKRPFPAERHLAWQIWEAAFELGVIIYYSQGCADGTNGDLIMFGPPLIIEPIQIDEMVAKVKIAVAQLLG